MLEESNCSKRACVHFRGVKNDGDERTERVVCDAFPQGIPLEIAYGDNPHTEPYEGDNGIQYEIEEGMELVPTIVPEDEIVIGPIEEALLSVADQPLSVERAKGQGSQPKK